LTDEIFFGIAEHRAQRRVHPGKATFGVGDGQSGTGKLKEYPKQCIAILEGITRIHRWRIGRAPMAWVIDRWWIGLRNALCGKMHEFLDVWEHGPSLPGTLGGSG